MWPRSVLDWALYSALWIIALLMALYLQAPPRIAGLPGWATAWLAFLPILLLTLLGFVGLIGRFRRR